MGKQTRSNIHLLYVDTIYNCTCYRNQFLKISPEILEIGIFVFQIKMVSKPHIAYPLSILNF